MIENIAPAGSLRVLAKKKSQPNYYQTVKKSLVSGYVSDGWTEERSNKTTSRISKPKEHGYAFEDRVWTLCYRMGFSLMSDERGAVLTLNPKNGNSPTNQIDVVAMDTEVALAIECKSAANYAPRSQFQEELGKFNLIRGRFSEAVGKDFPSTGKRQVALAMFLSKVRLSDIERDRASDANVQLFDEIDVAYYEQLIDQIGVAARYQFLADLLPKKAIPGLSLRVPAVQTRIGGSYAYSFCVNPEYLLKIGYISHRAKGQGNDVSTYQRMMKKSRLKQIRDFIEDDGVFPTNIVVSLEKKPRFDPIEQQSAEGAGRMGWLELRPSYKGAWIIDGQHRLYAFADLSRATTATLSVLAFQELSPQKQAEMFIDINFQQKRVSQSLLLELYGGLHQYSDDPAVRVRAILSRAIQNLGHDPDSPFFGRIKSSDDPRDLMKRITLTSLSSALNHSELFVFTPRKGASLEYGPLWGGDDPDVTELRIRRIVNYWFNVIREYVDDWWELGAAPGGGLSMNEGVSICIGVLRSSFDVLEATSIRLSRLNDSELIEILSPYASALGAYLGRLDGDDRRKFRELRGVQGVTTGRRRAERGVHQQIPSFNPPGLPEWIEQEKRQTNDLAKHAIDDIEITLQASIIQKLKNHFDALGEDWWTKGVPTVVRAPAAVRSEEHDNLRGGKEYYLDLINYREIIKHNWEVLKDTFGYTAAGNGKDKQTAWIQQINEIRKVVSHASSGQTVTIEQLEQCQMYQNWLKSRIEGDEELGEASMVVTTD